MSNIREMIKTVRKNGLRSAFKTYGWKLGLLIVGYYLVRDLTLYVFIPSLVLVLNSCL